MTVQLCRYRHCKGQEYTVLGVARHSETQEELVDRLSPATVVSGRTLARFLEAVMSWLLSSCCRGSKSQSEGRSQNSLTDNAPIVRKISFRSS